jgi:asparagine synthase (glutamine-hydrolysing)
MCGIAGIVDLSGGRRIPHGCLERMAAAMAHRGPDGDGYFEDDAVGLTVRRLAIVDVAGGHQPVRNEDGSIVAVANAECFDHAAVRRRLIGAGHQFRTATDVEILPHLWEDDGDDLFPALRGQFAVALYDRRRRIVVLARDRFGICPLYWARRQGDGGDWLLFASEIKALLASGLVPAAPDIRGIDQAFHFFAVPGPSSCFADVQILQPGHCFSIDLGVPGARARLADRSFWHFEFPDRGAELDGDEASLTSQLESLLLGAVERRLPAEVPWVNYVSGGVDSSLMAAMAAQVGGAPPPMFSVQVDAPHLDESSAAMTVAQHVGSTLTTVRVAARDVIDTYPAVIHAAEAPVIDTASAATLSLAAAVHRSGARVALTGEGADEWLGGYRWDKVQRLGTAIEGAFGARLGRTARRTGRRLAGIGSAGRARLDEIDRAIGHHAGFHAVYALMTASRFHFYSDDMLAALATHNPYLELEPDLDRMRRWHPLNQSSYWGSRIHLPGHLLSLKGDRVAMRSAVETRYPFLDEDVVTFLGALSPRLKLRGLGGATDKYLLRRVAERYLPKSIAWRRKKMFRGPNDSFFAAGGPSFVDELLSDASLSKTGWFRRDAVREWRDRLQRGQVSWRLRPTIELGLVGVVATQLWYHTFIDASLAALPKLETTSPEPARVPARTSGDTAILPATR